ncbi:hypothetical protein [Arthrobacter sp. HLT1-21]
MPVERSWASFHRFVELMIPLGPQITFLLRAHELDDEKDIAARSRAIDVVIREAISRGQHRGALTGDYTAEWMTASLHALLFTAWEHVDVGRLAKLDAPTLVIRSWLYGAAATKNLAVR